MSELYVPTFRNTVSVLKRWHIKFIRRCIIQEKDTTFGTWPKFEMKNKNDMLLTHACSVSVILDGNVDDRRVCSFSFYSETPLL